MRSYVNRETKPNFERFGTDILHYWHDISDREYLGKTLSNV